MPPLFQYTPASTTQPPILLSPPQVIHSAFHSPIGATPYAGAGVCKVGSSCMRAGETDDSPIASPAHAAGDGMGCGTCNPLSDAGALSELPHPKYCYVRTDVCDMDVACNIAEKTCGDNSAEQYYRPDTVPCAPPAWDTASYPESDLSPYTTPWDFPDKGLWATWSKQWVFDADPTRNLYYHTVWHGSKSNRVYACADVPQCSGAAITCPQQPALHTRSCREPMGACDVREFCTGAGDLCPPDALVHEEFVCKPRVPNAYLTVQSSLDPAGVRAGVNATYADEHYPMYATLPANLGKACWAVCQKSGPCSFCGTGKCCKRNDGGGGCLASEGDQDRHVCVLGIAFCCPLVAVTVTLESLLIPSNRRRLPSHRRRSPSNRRRLPSNRCRLPSHRRRLLSNRRSLRFQCLNDELMNGWPQFFPLV